MSGIEKILFPTVHIHEKRLQSRLCNKVVLITGASFGIGECIARQLACKDVTLILIARTEEKLLGLKYELEKKGARVYVFPADLYDVQQAEFVLQQIKRLSVEIDILIHNAGKSIFRPVEESIDRFHDFTRTMHVNYYAPVRLTLGLFDSLCQTKGHVIYISALNVLFSSAPGWAAYQASKTAMDSWGKAVAAEWKPKGVAVTAIYLPLVRTRMIQPTQHYNDTPAMLPEQAAAVVCKMILKRSRSWKPWWAFFPCFISFVLPGVWERIAVSRLYK